ncbi:MAG: PQQ-binding-like beta-propeller repeat protein [Vicinamibacterales bacterium]
MVYGNRQPIDLETGEIGVHSTPTIAERRRSSSGRRSVKVQTDPTHNNTKGLVQAFDAKSGKLLWTFNTDSDGLASSATIRGRTIRGRSTATLVCGTRSESTKNSAWRTCRSKRRLGLLRRPSARQQPVRRVSIVAVDVKTGAANGTTSSCTIRLWNFDNSSVADPAGHQRRRTRVKAVATPSKQAYLYVLDRATGKPVWPIEERPVPQSDVPGEKTAQTQPYPTKPPAYGRNFLHVPDDMIDFTPELRTQALDVLKRYKIGDSPFTPPILGSLAGLLGAVGAGTATNWPGSAADPELHVVYAQASNAPSSRSLVAPPAGFSDIRYVAGIAGRPFREVLGPGDCCAADGS